MPLHCMTESALSAVTVSTAGRPSTEIVSRWFMWSVLAGKTSSSAPKLAKSSAPRFLMASVSNQARHSARRQVRANNALAPRPRHACGMWHVFDG